MHRRTAEKNTPNDSSSLYYNPINIFTWDHAKIVRDQIKNMNLFFFSFGLLLGFR
jgi:hypothetical protein